MKYELKRGHTTRNTKVSNYLGGGVNSEKRQCNRFTDQRGTNKEPWSEYQGGGFTSPILEPPFLGGQERTGWRLVL